jgi:aminopeptidase-like protein
MYRWASDLYPICRSITGKGTNETLQYIKAILPKLQIHKEPTGAKAFDWTIPEEWEINDAFIANDEGDRIVDFKKHNLHIVGYSTAIDETLSFEKLDSRLYSLPELPDAIPYVTSYYKKDWGFCLTHNQRQELRKEPDKKYRVKIDARHFDGHLTYGELLIKGKSEKEIFLSAYICHPSMANNELSSPVVATALARYLQEAQRRYTYRIVFIPETIGSIVYLSKNLKALKEKMAAGFALSCVGDDRRYSYLSSRYANTLADRIAVHTLKWIDPDFKRYSFLNRGSDERQYCAPGVDLPVCSIMRSKFGEYPEYHTSLDDMTLISPSGLEGGFNAVKSCIEIAEANYVYKNTVLCEPQMSKRNLYPTTSMKGSADGAKILMDFLAYADGTNDLIGIAEILGVCAIDLIETANALEKAGLIEKNDDL